MDVTLEKKVIKHREEKYYPKRVDIDCDFVEKLLYYGKKEGHVGYLLILR